MKRFNPKEVVTITRPGSIPSTVIYTAIHEPSGITVSGPINTFTAKDRYRLYNVLKDLVVESWSDDCPTYCEECHRIKRT